MCTFYFRSFNFRNCHLSRIVICATALSVEIKCTYIDMYLVFIRQCARELEIYLRMFVAARLAVQLACAWNEIQAAEKNKLHFKETAGSSEKNEKQKCMNAHSALLTRIICNNNGLSDNPSTMSHMIIIIIDLRGVRQL